MRHHQEPESTESLAQQKQRLLQQCRTYRAAIGQSRNVVRAHLGADSIAKTAIGLIGLRAQAALAGLTDLFDLKHLSGAKLQRLVPLVVSGVSLLSRRAVWKPVLRGALVVGTTAATLYFFSRKKTRKPKEEHVALREHL